ncbi:MAG: class I SAM-dependent methyltransferase [Gaiellaceae bacterium]
MKEGADPWARWVLEKRAFGGDSKRIEASRDRMEAMRERVLAGADVQEGDVVLDVGTGDGLIAFAALPLVGESGKVIFSDVSEELLGHCREVAGEAVGCEFLVCSADDLPLADESVDVVTTRSVLIYVKDKACAFGEFHRVLRLGGRLSIFEPVNRFGYPWPPERFFGYDVTPMIDLTKKVMAVYDRLQPPDDPMLDFDERDLLQQVEEARFRDVRMTLEAEIEPRPMAAGFSWDSFLKLAGNPRVPPLEKVLDEALTPEEKERFSAHLRPLVERGEGDSRLAVAYLRAIK